jgi:hypothetical protein
MARLARFGWHPLLLLPVIFLIGCAAPYPYGYGYSDYGYPYSNGGYSYGGCPSGYAAPYGYGWPTPGGTMLVPVPVTEYYISGETYVTPSYQQADLPPDRHHPGRGRGLVNLNRSPRVQRGPVGGTPSLTSGHPATRPDSFGAQSPNRYGFPHRGAPAGRGLTRPSRRPGNTPQREGMVQRRPQALDPAPTAGRGPAAPGPVRRPTLTAPAR